MHERSLNLSTAWRRSVACAVIACGSFASSCSGEENTDSAGDDMGDDVPSDPSQVPSAEPTPAMTVETACTVAPGMDPPSCGHGDGECGFGNTLCPSPEGVPEDPSPRYVFSIPLLVPLTAGEPYVASIAVNHETTSLEVWGTNSECGSTDELLASTSVMVRGEENCFVLDPRRPYSHLLIVTRGDAGLGLFGLLRRRFCPADACPLPE